MRYFPIFMDLKDKLAIVVGGGEEALRKVRLLERTEARLVIVAEALIDEIASNPRVEWIARRFEPALLDGAAIAVCAETAFNEVVFAAARARNIPVNAVDDAEHSTFIVPSIVDRDPVVVAIGTEGAAPVLGQSLRARIDALLPQGLGSLARQAAALRQRVAAILPGGPRRRAFWARFFSGSQEGPIAWSQVDILLGESCAGGGLVTYIAVPEHEPDLLSLRAQRRLMQADVIVHDIAGVGTALEMARRDAVRSVASEASIAGLAKVAAAGKSAVRLCADTLPSTEIETMESLGISVECLTAANHLPPAIPHHPALRAIS